MERCFEFQRAAAPLYKRVTQEAAQPDCRLNYFGLDAFPPLDLGVAKCSGHKSITSSSY